MNDLSITALVLQASLVVQLVMAGLAITSLVSWTVIFGKLFGLKRVRNSNDEFEREFWSGRSLTELNTAVGQKAHTATMAAAFPAATRFVFHYCPTANVKQKTFVNDSHRF